MSAVEPDHPLREDFEELLASARRFAEARDDVVALVLVGSWARRAPKHDSDVDLVLITDDPSRYLARDEWTSELDGSAAASPRSWGPLTERRFRRRSGLEVDMGIAPLSWLSVDPVDPGTAEVISAGHQAIYDPECLIERFAAVLKSRAIAEAAETDGLGSHSDHFFAAHPELRKGTLFGLSDRLGLGILAR